MLFDLDPVLYSEHKQADVIHLSKCVSLKPPHEMMSMIAFTVLVSKWWSALSNQDNCMTAVQHN